MRGPGPTDIGAEEHWEATEESDIAVALVRTAFIIAFTLTPYVVDGEQIMAPFVRIMLLAAASFNLALFGLYLRRRQLPLKRPLALLVDLALVSSALSAFEDYPQHREWLVPIYYLIIMVAAIWFRRIGAVVTAFLASVLFGMFFLHLRGWSVLWHGHTPAMLLMAVTASYIVMARDRERQYVARLEHEMALARRLQDAIFPVRLPQMRGLDVGVSFWPARCVGGDLYDIIATDDRSLAVCIGDMPGKSVYGLVHLSLVHSHMRAAILEGRGPADVARVVNEHVYDALQPDNYAPLFVASIDASARTITFVNCGHLPPLLIRAGEAGECVELITGDMVIGGKRGVEYHQRVLPLQAGDTLVCYTDGVVEARGKGGEEFGAQRLVEVVRSHVGLSAEGLAQAITRASDAYSRTPQEDDRTVLVLKVVG